METALVTGANRGIGREVARELVRRGLRVLACARTAPARAPTEDGVVEQLDVADLQSIDALAKRLLARNERLDVLIQNAGVYRAPAREVWDVNVRGPLFLTRALVPLLNPGARVILVTSGLGALSQQDPSLVRELRDPALTLDAILAMAQRAPDGYGGSKAALNQMARLFAEALLPREVLVNAISPGWCATDMGGPGAPRSVKQGADSILWGTQLKPGGPTGGVFEDGRPLRD